ncbi:hypothetical protein K9N68_04150 [Kovacikia minuta CCNUW1]|uniref:hypothetical protein n=1 Tax=Kovacikia minuta TaxID=2931930 RepID=UPI001CCEEC92|nr:hypothetical protein [Kovacikia minuta]UBF27166.1 hypothetical protein K9N68_04150 [Kovacikia minuta CCNUW1]
MNTEELTQVVTAHQSAIARHDEEMASIRATLAEVAKSQAQNQAQQNLNTQAISQFTAGLEELRILVTNDIRGRKNL